MNFNKKKNKKKEISKWKITNDVSRTIIIVTLLSLYIYIYIYRVRERYVMNSTHGFFVSNKSILLRLLTKKIPIFIQV